MAGKKRNVSRGSASEGSGIVPEVSAEQQTAERFVLEATARAHDAAIFIVRNKVALEDPAEKNNALRAKVNEFVDALEADALQLAEYGERGVALDVGSFINSYNRYMVRASHALHRESLTPITLDFLHQQPLRAQEVEETQEKRPKQKSVVREGSEASGSSKRGKKKSGIDAEKNEQAVLVHMAEKEAHRVAGDVQRVRAWMQTMEDSIEAFAAGPFGVRFALEAERLRGVLTEMQTCVHTLEALEAQAMMLLGSARGALVEELRTLVGQLEALSSRESVAEADRLRDRVAGELRRIRNEVKNEIEAVFGQLAGDQIPRGRKFMNNLKKETDKGNDVWLAKAFEGVSRILREVPVTSSTPESSSVLGGDREVELQEQESTDAGEGSSVDSIPPFDPFTHTERSFSAALLAHPAFHQRDEERGAQKEKKEKKEKPELSVEQRKVLEDFLAFDFAHRVDHEAYATLDQFVDIAKILVWVRRRRIRVADDIVTRARHLFSEQMFGLSPERFLEQWKAQEDDYRREKAAAEAAGEDRLDERDEGGLPKMDEEARGDASYDRKDDDFTDGGETGEEDERNAFDDDTVLAFSPEQKAEIRARVDVFLKSLSAQDFWRDDVVLTEDQALLFGFSSHAERRNYLRRQLFLNGETEGVFFTRLVAQARNEDEARRILREILREVSGLTPPQRREIFAAEPGEEPAPEQEPHREGPEPRTPPREEEAAPEEETSQKEKQAETPPPPSSRPEPGPAPVGDEAPGPRAETPVSSSIFARARTWVREKARATDAALSNYDSYRAHIRGEVTRREQYGVSPTLSQGAMFAGGVLSAALSYFGIAFPVDAVRYATQRYFTGVERDEITEAFRVALAERRRRVAEAFEGEDVRERTNALRQRVEASRYLTDKQKADLLSQLEEQQDAFAAREEPHGEHLNREVGRILEHAIRTRVTGEKVAKEFVNSSLKAAALVSGGALAVAGFQFLRAPTYGAISIYGRWSRLTRENPDSSSGERLRSTILGGFTEWLDNAQGKKGRLAQAAAFGTAARFVGMSATFTEAAFHADAIGGLLGAWEHHEPAFPPEAHHLSEQGLAEAEQRVLQHAPGVHDGGVAVPGHDAAVSDYGRAEIHTHTDAYSDVRTPEADHGGDTGLDEGIAEEHVSSASEVVLSPEQIPSEALVRHGDGVTQSLLAAVEARPDLLSAADRAALHDDYAAALFMRRLAARDGLLDYWLSDKAIGNVAIVPQYDGSEAHIAFLNPETGNAYSFDELKALGWLIKAPKKAT